MSSKRYTDEIQSEASKLVTLQGHVEIEVADRRSLTLHRGRSRLASGQHRRQRSFS